MHIQHSGILILVRHTAKSSKNFIFVGFWFEIISKISQLKIHLITKCTFFICHRSKPMFISFGKINKQKKAKDKKFDKIYHCIRLYILPINFRVFSLCIYIIHTNTISRPSEQRFGKQNKMKKKEPIIWQKKLSRTPGLQIFTLVFVLSVSVKSCFLS